MEKARSPIEEIGENLCTEFQRVLPLDPKRVPRQKKLSESEIQVSTEAALEGFYASARAALKKHNLGLIARARVAFALQQRLLALGYSSVLVKQVLFAMLASVFVGDR